MKYKKIDDLNEGDLILMLGGIKYLVVRHNFLYSLILLGEGKQHCHSDGVEYTIDGLIRKFKKEKYFKIVSYEDLNKILYDNLQNDFINNCLTEERLK